MAYDGCSPVTLWSFDFAASLGPGPRWRSSQGLARKRLTERGLLDFVFLAVGFVTLSFPQELHSRFPTAAALAISRRTRFRDFPWELHVQFPEIANAAPTAPPQNREYGSCDLCGSQDLFRDFPQFFINIIIVTCVFLFLGDCYSGAECSYSALSYYESWVYT